MATSLVLVKGDTSGAIRIQLTSNGVPLPGGIAGFTVTAQKRNNTTSQVVAVTVDVVDAAQSIVELPGAQRADWTTGEWQLRIYVDRGGDPKLVDVFPSEGSRTLRIVDAWPGAPGITP